jgi:hypothetical protein
VRNPEGKQSGRLRWKCSIFYVMSIIPPILDQDKLQTVPLLGQGDYYLIDDYSAINRGNTTPVDIKS